MKVGLCVLLNICISSKHVLGATLLGTQKKLGTALLVSHGLSLTHSGPTNTSPANCLPLSVCVAVLIKSITVWAAVRSLSLGGVGVEYLNVKRCLEVLQKRRGFYAGGGNNSHVTCANVSERPHVYRPICCCWQIASLKICCASEMKWQRGCDSCTLRGEKLPLRLRFICE